MSQPVELPVARKLREATESGLICTECGAQFVKRHGAPTACKHCHALLPLAEQQSIKKATHPERNRVAHMKRNTTRPTR